MPSDTILCMYMYFLFLYKKCLYYRTIVEKMKMNADYGEISLLKNTLLSV